MSFTHNLHVDNQLDVNVDATILGTLAIGQSAVSDISAAFEINSTTKGLLFSRMTTSQRTGIASPVAGLMVYDITKNALYHYNGTSWVIMVRNMEDDSNIIIGNNTSGDSITTGAFGNIIIGRDCADNYSSNNSIFIGENVLELATDSSESVIIGANSGNLMTTGSIRNTSCGESSFLALTTGTHNTSVGNLSGGVITTGINNTLIGANTSGAATLSNQMALGYQATSDKANQVMVGNASVLEMVPHASANVNLGTSTNPWNELHTKAAMTVGTTLAIGQSTAIDASAILELESTTTGLLFPRMTSTQRNAIGSPSAGLMVYDIDEDSIYYYNGTTWTPIVKNQVDNSNIILGDGGAGGSLTTGAGFNMILGRGAAADVSTGSSNIFIGDTTAPKATVGDFNTFIGANIGHITNALTGGSNTSVGELSSSNLTSGVANTVVGQTGAVNLTTGSNNVVLGSSANCIATLNNQIALGYQATTTKTNQGLVGNSSLVEWVPDAAATANLGTSTNPWNNARLKGNASVGSSTDPVTSALLEMTSTTQGLLIPRMTTAQRLAVTTPADGLMVYDTDRSSIFVYNGTTGTWFNELSRKRFNAIFTQIIPTITITNGTWVSVPWNTEIIKDVGFTHAINSTNITFDISDEYLIHYNIVATTGGNSKTYQFRIEKNTGGGFVALPYSNAFGSSSGNEGNTVGTSVYHFFNAGDIIRITGQAISNSTSFICKPSACSIAIQRG